jgi:xanthine dehydrogenase accessory factor
MAGLVVIRGGGDLASGVGLRLHRAGVRILITELAQPLVVRRGVAFAQAVFSGQARVEEALAYRVENISEALQAMEQGIVPVLVDPDAQLIQELQPTVLVDGRMTKLQAETAASFAGLVIGLGPGFVAGENCQAVIETQRGHRLGRVIWQGAAQDDTGIPETVGERSVERVLRAPVDGILHGLVEIGEHLDAGQEIAEVSSHLIRAPFSGVLRGIIHSGLAVQRGLKIADLDPRDDPAYCWLVSDKSLAVGGGVLEAALSHKNVRDELWGLA